jgi:hypothetical protein
MAKEGKTWTEVYRTLNLHRLSRREQQNLKAIFDENKK